MLSQITIFGIISLVNFLTCVLIGIFVLFKAKGDRVNLAYCVFDFCVAFFTLFYFLWQSSNDQALGISFFKICIFWVVLINTTFLQFVFTLLEIEKKYSRYLLSAHALNAYFGYAALFQFYKDWKIKYSYGLWPVPSTVFNFYIIWWFLQLAICFLVLYQIGIKGSRTEKRKQFQWVFGATFVGFIGGATNWLVWYNVNFPPYLNSGIAIYSLILAYAIYKHQFLGIEVIVRRTAVFAGLFAFVYGIFTVVTVFGQELFKNTLGWNQWLALIPTVIIITFSLRPLENFLTNVTEKFLFQKKYDYRELLKVFTNEILTILDLQKLTEQTIAGLNSIIKVESACVFLFNKDTKACKMVAGMGYKEKDVQFGEHDTLVSYLHASHGPILKDKAVDHMEEEGDLKMVFKKLNARLCLPIMVHDNLIGMIFLGMKKSGEDYTQEDLDILMTLARTEAIAISNAQLFDELGKTQAEAAQREKMAVIGTLAAGINHEICNPLGIVRGQCEMFLLNLRDGFYKEKTAEEILSISSTIMNKVIKETDRATSITKKLSSFAKPSKRTDLEQVVVEKELEEVLGLIEHDLKLNNIEIQKDFPSNFPVFFGDKKQIQEVLFNIIRNAAQAMDKKDGKIALSGFSKNGDVIIRIADNGSGIPADKIAQIFNPFYTTKAPGKGTGLGLFIVKQIVERNKGTIAVESQAGIGTTFTLRFPKASEVVVERV